MPSPTNLSQLLVDAYIYQICIKDLAELKDVVNRSFIFLLSRQLMSTNSIFVAFIVFPVFRKYFGDNYSRNKKRRCNKVTYFEMIFRGICGGSAAKGSQRASLNILDASVQRSAIIKVPGGKKEEQQEINNKAKNQ